MQGVPSGLFPKPAFCFQHNVTWFASVLCSQNIVRINAAEAVEIFNTMNCYDWSSKSAQLDPQELLYQAAKAAVRDEKKAEAIENARLKRCDFVVQVEHPRAMRASLPLLPDPRFMYGLELPAVETQQ